MSSSGSKVKKNLWPAGIAMFSALTLVLFQNCSSANLKVNNPSLSAVTNNLPQQDPNDNPAQLSEPGSSATF